MLMPSVRFIALLASLAIPLFAAEARAMGVVPSNRPEAPAVRDTRLPMLTPGTTEVAPPAPRFERSLLLGQLGAAVAIPVATIALAASTGDASIGLVVAAASPLALGAAVCAIGNASDFYRGSCVATITGAAIGAFITVPLVILTANEKGGDAKTGNYSAALIAGGVGWLVIQPALAMVFYHGFRRLRSAPPEPRRPLSPPSLDRRLPAGPARGFSLLPGQVTVPMLSLSF
jgi:hypothetical protein